MKALLVKGLKALLKWLADEAIEEVQERLDPRDQAKAARRVIKYGKRVN